jgi:hypothetical protein
VLAHRCPRTVPLTAGAAPVAAVAAERPKASASRRPRKLGQCSKKGDIGECERGPRSVTAPDRLGAFGRDSRARRRPARRPRPPTTARNDAESAFVCRAPRLIADERGDDRCTHQSEEICVTILQAGAVRLMIGMRHCNPCILLHFVSNIHTVSEPKSPQILV